MKIDAAPLRSILLVPILILAACGDDDSSPTAPDPQPETREMLEVTTTIVSLEAINDGDGIEGAGDFRFTVTVPGEDKSWERTISTGNRASLDWTTTYRFVYSGNPISTYVKLRCSEIDKDITGREYNDGDMDLRFLEAYESVPSADITNYMTLGNDECKVRLHYRITSKVIEVEI